MQSFWHTSNFAKSKHENFKGDPYFVIFVRSAIVCADIIVPGKIHYSFLVFWYIVIAAIFPAGLVLRSVTESVVAQILVVNLAWECAPAS